MSGCCSPLGGNSGGGGFAPIQNTRYWDPTFVGTSTGSIGAPYTTLTPFFAEVAATEAGWELWLPPKLDLIPGGTVPDLTGGGVTLRGLSPSTTYLDGAWTIGAQTNEPQMDFHDMGLIALVAEGGTVHFELVNCFVDTFNVGALDGGSARLRSCQVTGCAWPTTGFSLEVIGGSMNGDCSWSDGRFWNVKLGGGSNFTPGAAQTRFIGCTFDGGISISNANAPTLVMDTYSYASFIENAVAYAGTIIVLGAPKAFGFELTAATTSAGDSGPSNAGTLTGAPYPFDSGFLLTAAVTWSAHVVAGYFQVGITLEASADGGSNWVSVGTTSIVSTVVNNNPTFMQATATALLPALGVQTNFLVRYRLDNDAGSASAVTGITGQVTAIACEVG